MSTRNKTIAAAIGVGTPVPTANASPVPLICNLNGVQYVLPIDGSATLLQFVPNNQNFNDSSQATWVPGVSLGFIHDSNAGQWLQLEGQSNDSASHAPDAVYRRNLPVLTYPYLYDPIANTFRRQEGRTNDAESVSPDTDSVNYGCLSFAYMVGKDFQGNAAWTRLSSQSLTVARLLSQSLQVVNTIDQTVHDAPLVNTAAVAFATDPNGFAVKVAAVGYSITAVGAIAAPVLIELREDASGANNLLWSTQELLPVGTSKTIMIPLNLKALVDATLTVDAPGATNFVTATLVYNDSLSSSPL